MIFLRNYVLGNNKININENFLVKSVNKKQVIIGLSSFFIKDSSSYNIDLYFSYWSEQYMLIFFFCVASLVITCVLLIVASILSPKEVTFEKVSVYECGFEPYGEANVIFNIQFFVVGILFMLFDLEIIYLLPWVVYLSEFSVFSFWLMVIFLMLLVVGFIYEWKKGALDWL